MRDKHKDRAFMIKKILFITRNYPPKVGGLEAYSFHLIREFEARTPTYKITLSMSKKHLVWFLPYAFFKAWHLIRKHSIHHVHLCDGLLGPVGLALKRLLDVRVSITIHGLDITYDNGLYQRIIPWCVERLDKMVCVSHSTRDQLLQRTRIPTGKSVVIPNGILPNQLFLPQSKSELRRNIQRLVPILLSDKKLLITVGHLVKRKGVAWFVDRVMWRLGEEYLYLVAGEGPERIHIEKAIARHHLERQVCLLGKIPDDLRNMLYNASDIFIMPNMRVFGDMEGFGVVALEAGSCGLPVIASNIEGIQNAVIDEKTGYLVREGDVEGFLRGTRDIDLKKADVKSEVASRFNWEMISREYFLVLFQ